MERKTEENIFQWNNMEIKFLIERYSNNNELAIEVLYFEEEYKGFMPYATLSVCIPGFPLLPNQVLVKLWSENKSFSNFTELFPQFFTDLDFEVPSGFVSANLWEISEEFLSLESK